MGVVVPLTTSILRWAHLAADWEVHRPANHELSVLERGRIEKTSNMRLRSRWGIPLTTNQFRGQASGTTLRRSAPTPSVRFCRPSLDRVVRGITSERLHLKCSRGPMSCCAVETRRANSRRRPGRCERFHDRGQSGFKITLASDAFPTTVFHQVADTLAFAEDGRFQHRDRWLFYFNHADGLAVLADGPGRCVDLG